MKNDAVSLVVLISGNGSTLQAIIDQIHNSNSSAQITCVISDNPHAMGLARAEQANIATQIVNHQDYPDRAGFDKALQQRLQAYQPDLVVLAGFMHILSDSLVNAFHGHMINTHPSLLPKFKGLHTYQRALAAGEQQHGATVHFVTSELDGGPIIAQSRFDIQANDTVISLEHTTKNIEHWLYPQVIQWYIEGRLQLTANGVTLDKRLLSAQGQQFIKRQLL